MTMKHFLLTPMQNMRKVTKHLANIRGSEQSLNTDIQFSMYYHKIVSSSSRPTCGRAIPLNAILTQPSYHAALYQSLWVNHKSRWAVLSRSNYKLTWFGYTTH